MRQSKHPLVEQDLIGIIEHIVEVTHGDLEAALRRLDEVDALLREIAEAPSSGMRLSGPLDGWLVRHGGRGNRLTIVFRLDGRRECLMVALVSFGGRDWMALGESRIDTDF